MNNSGYIYCLLIMLLATIAVIHITSFFYEPFQSLFVKQTRGYGDWTATNEVLYGDAGFCDFSQIFNNIAITLVELFSLFNVELSGDSMMSIRLLIAIIRIIIIIYIFVVATKNAISIFIKRKDLNPVDFVLSLGIIINLIVIIVSNYGSANTSIRYMVIILFYGTVLLCRNISEVISISTRQSIPKMKRMIAIIFALLIVINVQKIWVRDDYNPEYEKQMERASEFIINNNLGNGIAGHWDSAIISGFSNGKIIMLDGSSDIGNISKDYNAYSKALQEIPLNFVMETSYEKSIRN